VEVGCPHNFSVAMELKYAIYTIPLDPGPRLEISSTARTGIHSQNFFWLYCNVGTTWVSIGVVRVVACDKTGEKGLRQYRQGAAEASSRTLAERQESKENWPDGTERFL
jgi:hypothetical protein